MRTVWVLGDQLDRRLAHLDGAQPDDTRVLFVVSLNKIRSAPWHRQRLHFILAAMRRFAAELTAEGFEVDWRVAETMAAGVAEHVRACRPTRIDVMQPMNMAGQRLIDRLASTHPINVIRNDQFLCHRDDFAEWATANRRRDGSLLLEDFYRWQRRRLGILIEPDGEPTGGRWNFDDENRLPPPKGAHPWPTPLVDELDDIDAEITQFIDSIDGVRLVGAAPTGLWSTSRAGALARLDHFVATGLAGFGPYEDAVLAQERHLNHSMLSPYLNVGLLHPDEVVAAALAATDVPINSREGFVRQMIGWREYVHGIYWWHGADYAASNFFDADDPLPPSFTGAPTEMRCVAHVAQWVSDDAWTHHIPRLMVLANLATLAGTEPQAMVKWMWANFIDGADWVMVPNLIGMGLYADGGQMSTKPYVSGGNYISKMTDFCRGCRFDKSVRTGDDACPFTTLYWDFLDRHRDRLRPNHRMARVYANLDRLADLDDIRTRAVEVRRRLSAGTL